MLLLLKFACFSCSLLTFPHKVFGSASDMEKVDNTDGGKTRSDVNNENGKMYEKMLTSRFISHFHSLSTRLVSSLYFILLLFSLSRSHFRQDCVRILFLPLKALQAKNAINRQIQCYRHFSYSQIRTITILFSNVVYRFVCFTFFAAAAVCLYALGFFPDC